MSFFERSTKEDVRRNVSRSHHSLSIPNILPNIFFCVLRKKLSHAGLKQHGRK